MKNISVGYILNEPYLKKDDKLFIELARDRNIGLVLINTAKNLSEKELEEKIKKCDIVFNNSAENFSIEVVKTVEELGKKVIDSSKKFYYDEDKWLFFLKCREHGIPTLKTILLPQNLNSIKKELEEFREWPVVLKRIEGTEGEYVAKADNAREAKKIVEVFWKKGSERLPIIAQEFVSSPSYRVTVIGDKIVQTAIKKSNGWKATGVYLKDKNVGKFSIDKELKKIVSKICRVFSIKVCGIDLLRKDGKWLVLEINAEPGLDFFAGEERKLIGKILDFLRKEVNKKVIK
jgi:ribosomal protein S6--L-glutamate ligase